MDDLKIIKKYYGEKMMHLCKRLFPTILEQPSVLSNILLNHFEPQKSLFNDITKNRLENEFKNYIYNIFYPNTKKKITSNKTPNELLDEAGYILYECKTEEEIQYFKRYYIKGEELCTFKGKRLDMCTVFFAVKKDVENIKRKDFINPKRQDEYGTSVISIQFTKDESHTLSIKNRYNHTVDNPDATFSNNLDNIIYGLTESFEREYGLTQKSKNDGFEIPGYVKANDGKYYKYNIEINKIYYCPNNIIIDNFEVKRYPKEKYIIMDYFIFDLVTKKIKLYDESEIDDCFPNSIKNIKKIEIKKDNQNEIKNIIVTINNYENIIIKLNKSNEIVELEDSNIKEIDDNFLVYNETLEEVNLPKLQQVGDNFLERNQSLTKLVFPNLKQIGNDFMYNNENLKEIIAQKLQIIGDYFLYRNEKIEKINFPTLQIVGSSFLYSNSILFELEIPKLQQVKNHFLYNNIGLINLHLPKLQQVGDSFIARNKHLVFLDFPKLQQVGNEFLYNNTNLEELKLIELQKAGNKFLQYNKALKVLTLPKIQLVGDYFISRNQSLEIIYLPELEYAGRYFLQFLESNCNLCAPNLKTYTL